MNQSINRRSFITSAGILCAGAPLLAVEKPVATSVVSPAILSSASLVLGQIAVRIKQKTVTPADIQTYKQTVALINEHFNETGVNNALMLAAQQMDTRPFYIVGQVASAAQVELNRFGLFTSDDMWPLWALTQNDCLNGLEQVRKDGLNTILGGIQPSKLHAADMGDIDDGAGGGDAQAYSICPTVTFYMGGIGAAAFMLQLLGCTPEPIFVVLCPTITTINLLLGIAAVGAWILC